MANEKVTYYKRWDDTIKDLPDAARLEVYDAIVQYAFYDSVMPFESQLAKVAFGFIKQEIDHDNAHKAEISAKRKLAGRKGGAPKCNQNAVRTKKDAESTVTADLPQEELFGKAEVVATPKKPAKPQKQPKHRYADDVLLTEEEYQKLYDQYGEDGVTWMITKLDNYKASRGTTYKSDYRAILNWVVDEYKKQHTQYGTHRTSYKSGIGGTAPSNDFPEDI